jgi:hypothetical protein
MIMPFRRRFITAFVCLDKMAWAIGIEFHSLAISVHLTCARLLGEHLRGEQLKLRQRELQHAGLNPPRASKAGSNSTELLRITRRVFEHTDRGILIPVASTLWLAFSGLRRSMTKHLEHLSLFKDAEIIDSPIVLQNEIRNRVRVSADARSTEI